LAHRAEAVGADLISKRHGSDDRAHCRQVRPDSVGSVRGNVVLNWLTSLKHARLKLRAVRFVLCHLSRGDGHDHEVNVPWPTFGVRPQARVDLIGWVASVGLSEGHRFGRVRQDRTELGGLSRFEIGEVDDMPERFDHHASRSERAYAMLDNPAADGCDSPPG